MKRAKIIKLLFVLLLTSNVLNAQEVRDEESLNFTYLGPSFSYARNQVQYTDWFNTSTETKKMSGTLYSGGLALDIFAEPFCGDFQIKYAYSQLDFALTYLEFCVSGKYYYPVNAYLSLGGGVGLYLETPPSNKDHNGAAGLQLPLSFIVNTSASTKLFVDIFARYGNFGIGENTESISAGVNVGFIFKVGRI